MPSINLLITFNDQVIGQFMNLLIQLMSWESDICMYGKIVKISYMCTILVCFLDLLFSQNVQYMNC